MLMISLFKDTRCDAHSHNYQGEKCCQNLVVHPNLHQMS